MNFGYCFKATDASHQNARCGSERGLASHNVRASEKPSNLGVWILVKCFLCFLTIAPPMLGQVSAAPPADAANTGAVLPDNPGAEPSNDELADSAGAKVSAESTTSNVSSSGYGHQTKRILYIMPNFHAVSTGSHLPAQSPTEKLLTATQDSFDYSSFIFVGMLAGLGQAQRSTPEFGQGTVGYGRYYWHTLADQTDENYFVEGFMPIVFREDTRYYTLGRGGFLRRTVYAVSRAAITRSDAGEPTPNYSEIIGAGAAAGISNLYYPGRERTWTKTGQRWVLNVGLDVLSQAFKEFWPDFNRKIFHQ